MHSWGYFSILFTLDFSYFLCYVGFSFSGALMICTVSGGQWGIFVYPFLRWIVLKLWIFLTFWIFSYFLDFFVLLGFFFFRCTNDLHSWWWAVGDMGQCRGQSRSSLLADWHIKWNNKQTPTITQIHNLKGTKREGQVNVFYWTFWAYDILVRFPNCHECQ